jgi:nocturnin
MRLCQSKGGTSSDSRLRSMSRPSQELLNSHVKLRRKYLRLADDKSASCQSFKILTWNVLADGLAQNGDFVKAPQQLLEWSYRMPLIVEELHESQADIICLQEVNRYEDLEHQLCLLGYQGCFLAKISSPCERYHCPPDGVAIFYKPDRFQIEGQPQGTMFLDDDGLRRSQGFLQVSLRDTACDRQLIVVTTHLKAKEGAAEEQIRIQQIRQLLHHLKKDLLTESALEPPSPSNSNGSCHGGDSSNVLHGGSSNGHHNDPKMVSSSSNGSGCSSPLPHAAKAQLSVPVVILGDFNATPESQTCREIRAHPSGLQSIWEVKVARETGNLSPILESIERLASSFFSAIAVQEFSTWKFRSKGESKRVIDHMWFTPRRTITPVARWKMLSEEEIGPDGLPCASYPSDHQALLTEFVWKDVS